MTATIKFRWRDEDHLVPKWDTQRSKIYRAERQAFGKDWSKLISEGDLDATIAFVRRVEKSETWEKVNEWAHSRPPRQLLVKDGRGCRSARGARYHLVLPRWARTMPVVLHEMAHSPCNAANHNWPFAAIFLALVGRFMGAEARDALKAAFKKNRVRFTPPRQFSDEHMARLRAQGQRLAAAAAKKREEGK